jgi:hypothetical protein
MTSRICLSYDRSLDGMPRGTRTNKVHARHRALRDVAFGKYRYSTVVCIAHSRPTCSACSQHALETLTSTPAQPLRAHPALRCEQDATTCELGPEWRNEVCQMIYAHQFRRRRWSVRRGGTRSLDLRICISNHRPYTHQ